VVDEAAAATGYSRSSPVERPAAADTVATARAPLPGKIVEILVGAGDTVERGQTLGVLEAMKMQNAVCATRAGRVRAVHVNVGDEVTHGQALFEIEP
jgi:biotin carboxyl carrier protein